MLVLNLSAAFYYGNIIKDNLDSINLNYLLDKYFFCVSFHFSYCLFPCRCVLPKRRIKMYTYFS